MNESEKLLDMKKQIDKAKADISRLKGSRDQLFLTLKKDHGCASLEDAQIKLNVMDGELNRKETTLAEGIVSLENEYDWK